MANAANNLIWVDLEMTGLDVERERIIEIATIVTDGDLHVIAEGPDLIINQPQQFLDQMDDWNQKQHGKSGLIAQVRESTVTVVEAEARTLAFLAHHVQKGVSPMCGNTICQDRRFLHRYMPELERYFHYRHVDVSTLKELAKRWRPEIFNGVKKNDKHRALQDIKDTIAELVYYRQHFVKLD